MTSLKGTARLALPLMLSSLSSTLMITVDRIMLASYDTMAMNAIAAIGILLFMLERGIGTITSMSEVLCGQFNGAKNYSEVASPVWQMLFFTLFLMLAFIPIGLCAGPYVIPSVFHEEGLGFFRILICTLFLSHGFMAINGFFIGTKQTKVIAIAAIIANGLNILLDYFFIFGIDGILEPMGATGAAIGSSIALLVQFIIVFSVFLSKKQHQQYNTRSRSFNLSIMLTCLRIGVPDAFGYVAGLLGLYMVVVIVADAGIDLVTVHNICQTVFIFIWFASEGIQKAVIGMGANLLGARKYDEIWRLISSAIKLQIVALAVMAIPLLIFPDYITSFYTKDESILRATEATMVWVWVYYAVDGFTWILGSMLVAGGDTTFVCLAVFVCTWFLRVMPLYLLENAKMLTYETSWQSGNISDGVLMIIFFLRLKYGNWRKVIVASRT